MTSASISFDTDRARKLTVLSLGAGWTRAKAPSDAKFSAVAGRTPVHSRIAVKFDNHELKFEKVEPVDEMWQRKEIVCGPFCACEHVDNPRFGGETGDGVS